MKSTGIVRKIDELGRVVLPMELRKTMDLSEGTPIEIFVEGSFICLRKYEPGCIFCGNVKDVREHMDKTICGKCLCELKGA